MRLKTISSLLISGSVLLLTGCFGGNNTATQDDTLLIKSGDTVTVEYSMGWSDKKVFATNVKDAKKTSISTYSLDRRIQETFSAGDINIIRGQDIVGKKLNDTFSSSVTPVMSNENKNYKKELIQEIPKNSLGADATPTKGDIYEIAGQMGYVTSLSGKNEKQMVTLDLNPRETRDTYTYSIKITDIIK